MVKSMRETYRRREIQEKFNKENNINPTKASSNIKQLESVRTDQNLDQQFTGITK